MESLLVKVVKKQVQLVSKEIEEWIDIPYLVGSYQISSFGRVKSLDRKVLNRGRLMLVKGRIMKPGTDRDGYLYVNLSSSSKIYTYKVHRLVCIAFHLNPENKPQVNHKDGIKTNNYKGNVEWSTQLENMCHSSKNGLVSHGEGRYCSKITEKMVKLIRNSTLSGVEFSKKYNVSQGIISDVRLKRTWKHVK